MSTEQTNIRPENWNDILHKNVSLEWVKAVAKFYILNYSDRSSYACIWKTPDTEGRGWNGVRMKREYHKDKGYYIEFEPFYTDVQWTVEMSKEAKELTTNFEEALELANTH